VAGERALILIPCSGTKYQSLTGIRPRGPIDGISSLRGRMVHLTGNISSGTAVPAASLYQGALYRQCRESLEALANEEYPGIDLLIVSAFFGVVHPAEPISQYELRMGDEIAGYKVYRWWQKFQLGAVLEAYVEARGITRVWSLLGSSPPWSQYQQSLNPFWQRMKGKVACRQVIVPGGGQSNSSRRGSRSLPGRGPFRSSAGRPGGSPPRPVRRSAVRLSRRSSR